MGGLLFNTTSYQESLMSPDERGIGHESRTPPVPISDFKRKIFYDSLNNFNQKPWKNIEFH